MATASYLILKKREESLASIVLHIGFWGGLISIVCVSSNTSYEFNSILLVIVGLTALATWVASYLASTASLSIFLLAG